MRIAVVEKAQIAGELIPHLKKLMAQDEFEEVFYLGNDVLARWEQQPPDRIILSRHTPVHENMSLNMWISRLANWSVLRNTHIILLTEPIQPDDHLVQTCVSNGITNIIEEPHERAGIDPGEIVDVLQNPRGASAVSKYRPAEPPGKSSHTLPGTHSTSSTEEKSMRTYFNRRPKAMKEKERGSGNIDGGRDAVRAVRQIIVVQGMGGGVGTTLTAVKVAQQLTQMNATVWLLDWDPRGALASWLGKIPPDQSCWEAADTPDIAQTRPWTQHIWAADPKHCPKLHVLTSNGHHPERPIIWDPGQTEDMMRWGMRTFDFIVVDAGSQWAETRHAQILSMADGAVLVTGSHWHHQRLAVQWLRWAEANQWPINERHFWIGIEHGVDKQGQREWERAVGERWVSTVDLNAPPTMAPFELLAATVTARFTLPPLHSAIAREE